MHIIQSPLFDFEAFIEKKSNDRLAMVLEAIPAEGLISVLEKENKCILVSPGRYPHFKH